MIDRFQYQKAVEKASAMLRAAGLVITPAERERFEVADFGLNELEKTGLQIITYVNTDRCCAKEIMMTPGQTCPEHQHPTIGWCSGKGGNVPLPLGNGLPLCAWNSVCVCLVCSARGVGALLHGLPRNLPEAWRAVHAGA